MEWVEKEVELKLASTAPLVISLAIMFDILLNFAAQNCHKLISLLLIIYYYY